MKEVFRSTMLLVGWIAVPVAGFGESWHTGFEDAEREAREARQVLLVHFYADWCGPCREMERSVLSQPAVTAALSEGIVAVKINSDRRADLVARFQVRSLPTDVFVNTDGKVVARHVGSPGLQSYVARLQQHRVPADSLQPDHSSTTAVADLAAVQTQQQIAATDPVEHSTDQPSTKTVQPVQTVLVNESRRRIGLGGYSPVALQQSVRWQKGTRQVVAEYQGVCYLFQTEQEKQVFEQDAERYVPVMHGFDPVAYHRDRVMTKGAIDFCARYRERFYFFASQANRDAFLNNPDPYTEDVQVSFFSSVQTADASL